MITQTISTANPLLAFTRKYSVNFAARFVFSNIAGGEANSIDDDQTAPSGGV